MSMRRDLLIARRLESDAVSNSFRSLSRQGEKRCPSSGPATGQSATGAEAVQVAVRVRPPNCSDASQELAVTMDPSRSMVFLNDRLDGQRMFSVDMPIWSCAGRALDDSAPVTQSVLYERVGRPLLAHAIAGFNSTLIAYGQTGSGKTYTMMGEVGSNFMDDNEDVLNKSEEGIIPRLCRDMFQEIQRRSVKSASGESVSWEVQVSFVEVYCEKISDLLNRNTPVSLREEVAGNETFFALTGVRRVPVSSTEDILRALKIGNGCRKKASTSMNERSSRSHAIFIVELTEIISIADSEGEVASAPRRSLAIRLVDLAGSERIGESGVSGPRFKEGVDINLSLFTLGLVIESLSDPRRRNIKPPYRESTLTKILKEAFGGNSKTTMICTVAPSATHRSETLQTLQYASKARCVMNKPHVDENPSATILCKANEELVKLRCQLLEAGQGGAQHRYLILQLAQANQRLRQEQESSRRRKAFFEKQKEELAAHFRKEEEEREVYGNKLQQLSAEVKRAKLEQKEKERELHHALCKAEECRRENESQRELLEKRLNRQSKDMLKRQRDAEGRVQQLESTLGRRVDELLDKVENMKEELKSKERASTERGEEPLEKSASRERELNGRLLEARSMIQQLQARIEATESDMARRILEAKREAQERERELSDEIQKADHDVKLRDAVAQKQWEEEMSIIRKKEMRVRQREEELAELEQELKARTAKQGTQIERKEEVAEKTNEMEQLASRERHATLRLQFELQRASDCLYSSETKRRVEEEEEESDDDKNKFCNLNRRFAQLEKTLAEREAVLRKKEEDIEARERELDRQQQQWEKEAKGLSLPTGTRTIADFNSEAEAINEAAKMLENGLNTRFVSMDADTGNLATCLQLGGEALLRRKPWSLDCAEERERNALGTQGDNELCIIKMQMQLEEKEMRLCKYELRVESMQQRNCQINANWFNYIQELCFSMEKRFREFLDSSRVGEYDLIKRLEDATLPSFQGSGQHEALNHARGMDAFEIRRAELRLRTEGVVEEESPPSLSTVSFEQPQHRWDQEPQWEDEERKEYLFGREEMDREKMAEHRRTREELVATREQLHRRELALRGYAERVQCMFLEQVAAQRADSIKDWERTEREYIAKMYRLHNELRLCRDASEGNQEGAQNLLKLKEAELHEAGNRMRCAVEQLEADEVRWQKRVADEEQQLRMYRLSLEGDGEQYIRGVEAKQEELERREAALGARSSCIQQEAEEREQNLRWMEEQLQKQRAEEKQSMQERAADIARRHRDVASSLEENERTFSGQESDLRELIAKNEEVKQHIQQCDVELQRYHRNYIDLRRLLEDREKLLLCEHAHRMNGKNSATQLTEDLLYVNELLKKQLEVWIQKYNVLKVDEKLECERCSWRNTRDATVCRCCGNPNLV
ncbi:Unc104-like kinesin, putative [Trypanosoma cruzi marinkellei]|uniref:Unc104-like kinesin, putative n=1 Tax=Trypanosoma cruzi marinkellei TaxID=85056 RepID=K2NLE6_TRYCR|nr:Unc104-like kinesin, putative [Trypanosoma cruzi marinkellei]EKF33056.1 Unc104-like kinesin, putative [Trypanosoma cruzi marinkellei]